MCGYLRIIITSHGYSSTCANYSWKIMFLFITFLKSSFLRNYLWKFMFLLLTLLKFLFGVTLRKSSIINHIAKNSIWKILYENVSILLLILLKIPFGGHFVKIFYDWLFTLLKIPFGRYFMKMFAFLLLILLKIPFGRYFMKMFRFCYLHC